MTEALFAMDDVTVALRSNGRKMVTGVGLSVKPGEAFGVVGESGSGKTLLTRTVFGLQDDAELVSGRVRFDGQLLPEQGYARAARKLLGGRIGFVPQDPFSSLNPTMRVGKQITEALYLARGMPMGAQRTKARAIEVLGEVGIPEPELAFNQFPDQFSGGMRQRIVFAIALAQEPKLLIADEPTTALDAITQRRVIELMLGRCRSHGMALILISHNLELLRQSVDRIAVLYGGQLHNITHADDIGSRTVHPYTEALFECIPSKEKTLADIRAIPGEPVGAGFGTKGCAFASRCRYAEPICRETQLPLNGDQPGRFSACLLGRGADA
ncbi:ABC transporter ATP-binding protein [Arsenicitalea aurantiaca]|uniref:ABC transporter ATP-binding protein n=1 Tax=Arsenicitalea aurantiaca TaxID=1783274 RepID=A0A433XEF0_9HYPH|nr:ABC transporter ATP-binding protein [Arsenicitalea aurantiaca]RUT32473.1 ABC transporter ATP-binding protein [Arsenicitalea aurantiaca]